MQNLLKRLGLPTPAIHVVLGSGFGSALDELGLGSEPGMQGSGDFAGWKVRAQARFVDLEGLTAATVPGHPGVFRYLEHTPTGAILTFQVGRIHGYEGHSPRTVVLPVVSSFLAGTRKFILTNAAGGIDPSFTVGSVMLIRDQFNMTGQNPLTGHNPEHGPRFPDMTGAYDAEMRERFRAILKARGDITVFEGVYLGLSGPSFETPTEVQVFRSWGMGSVGMSTVWETLALRHAGAKVAGLSLISNAAAGMGDGKPLDHELILEESKRAARKIVSAVLTYADQDLSGGSRS